MIWAIQAISIAFALAMAWHNAPAVSQFEHSGINNLWMARFHRYGWWTRAVFVGICSLVGPLTWWDAGARGLMSFLWVYLIFDIALNRSRIPARLWHYLGLNDADGRFWNGTFGRYAGKIKAAIISSAIVAANMIYQWA